MELFIKGKDNFIIHQFSSSAFLGASASLGWSLCFKDTSSPHDQSGWKPTDRLSQ
jgi:hypothetical protein